MNKKIILISCFLICSICGGYFFLSNEGIIPPFQVSDDAQKVINEADKKNVDELKEVQATEDEQALIDTNLEYKDELLLTDEEITAMAQEYQVSEKEIKENIDYFNYQWQLDHPSNEVKAAYTETVINKKTIACNNHEITTNDSEIDNLQGTAGLKKLASWISKNFNHKKGASTTAQGVLNTHYGDCWGLTNLSKLILLNEGYSVKVIELKTCESYHHRALEVLTEKGWIRFDPSMVTAHYNCKPYYCKVGHVTRVLEVYQ